MMSTLTVFCIWAIFAAGCLAGNFTTSSRCISCSCGSSDQNYTHCFQDTLEEQQTCDRWANCQTCSDNSNFCSSCPPDCFGPTCSEVCGRIPHRPNEKRGPPHRPGDWPWSMGIAALTPEDAESLFCGGVILDKKTVLTAAQCVTGTQNIRLLFGTTYPTPIGNSGSEQKRSILQVVLHPDFDNETKANDIAVLKFEPELKFSQTIQPICLPDINSFDKFPLPGQKGIIPGWGYNYTMYMTIPAVNYEVANVSVQPDDKCMETCQTQGLPSFSSSKAFCADYPKGVDACMYRGVPMLIYDQSAERYTLAGLVTRKLKTNERNCRRGEISTVLTNVSNFMPFIRKHSF